MMSLPENWNYTLKGLANLSKDNVDSVRQGINELKNAGYIVQHQIKVENGRWGGSIYDVYEEPQIAGMGANAPDETAVNMPVSMKDPTVNRSTPDENNLTGSRSTHAYDLTDSPSLENPITVKIPIQNGDDLTDLPSLDFPITEKPITENPTLLNTNKLNIKDNNINQSIYRKYNNNIPLTRPEKPTDGIDGSIEKRRAYKKIVHENIEYDRLTEESEGMSLEDVDELVELMLDVICADTETLRVGGNEMRTDIVKSRFLKLTKRHIEYVMECLENNTSKVRNIRAYIITCLYNASATLGAYHTAEAAHDANKDNAFKSVKTERAKNRFVNFTQRDNDLDEVARKLNDQIMQKMAK